MLSESKKENKRHGACECVRVCVCLCVCEHERAHLYISFASKPYTQIHNNISDTLFVSMYVAQE